MQSTYAHPSYSLLPLTAVIAEGGPAELKCNLEVHLCVHPFFYLMLKGLLYVVLEKPKPIQFTQFP